jgi:CheY-like chemotaxis protein/anti-sigma regulatory factor (Ser/Thr protein kinase)
LNAEQQQQVSFVRKAAEDLYELVNDLLDLAKVEAGKVEVKPVEFEVANLFGALRGMLRPLFLNQSVNLVFESPRTPELPPVYSDEGKISQILRNFISNALKFTERGEVRVSAEVVDGDHIKFSVADTGIGIAPEDHERIFQDFAQIENPIQRRVKGTGLGLPLSRKLAHLLGGEVQLTSEVGAGSTFSVVLPVAYRKQPGTADAGSIDLQPGMKPLLVIENSDEAVLLYSKWLKDSEFQIVRAATVAEAQRKLAAFRPALIILDILLRGEDSWSLLAKVKGIAGDEEIPVLVVTTLDDPRKGLSVGRGRLPRQTHRSADYAQRIDQVDGADVSRAGAHHRRQRARPLSAETPAAQHERRGYGSIQRSGRPGEGSRESTQASSSSTWQCRR